MGVVQIERSDPRESGAVASPTKGFPERLVRFAPNTPTADPARNASAYCPPQTQRRIILGALGCIAFEMVISGKLGPSAR